MITPCDTRAPALPQRTANHRVPFLRAEPPRGETAVFVSLGLAGLLAIGLAGAAMFDFVGGSDRIATSLSPGPSVKVGGATNHRPAPLSRLSADARTLAAAIRFILDA